MARSTPYTPYKVNELAVPTDRPQLIDVKVRGELVNRDGDRKEFEMDIQDIYNTGVRRFINAVIACEMPGYRVFIYWRVS